MKKKQHKATRSEATIADVLHYAADKCLAYDRRFTADGMKEKFSCLAVTEAIYQLECSLDGDSLYDRVFDGLKAMGCDISNDTLFMKYGDQPDNVNETVQGMRYMWLKWAALMAEEQGV